MIYLAEKHVRSTEVPDGETSLSCTNLLKTLNFLRKKILRLSTEVPDGETTVSCTNLLETLNFLREKILQYFLTYMIYFPKRQPSV